MSAKHKMAEQKCEVCRKPAKQFCSSCREVFYCSRDCQKQDWKTHKAKCKPFVIKTHPVYGRYMVASRDIRAGEVILKEPHLVIGPKQRSAPVCLGCHKSVTGSYICKGCNFPVCAPSCEISKYHKAECQVLARATGKIRIDNMSAAHPAYECILPLRCILLKESDPKKWEEIRNMQDHVEDIKNTELHNVIQRNTVEFLKHYLKFDGVDSEEVYRVCGILMTNSFELKHHGTKVRGLYAQSAMMAHDCIPNTKHTFETDSTMILRATRVIPKGSAITSTYTNTLWNTLQRRKQIKVAKFFLCNCRRCSDATELGTHLSTLVCSQCGGDVVSTKPLDMDASWACTKCNQSILGRTVFWGNQQLYKELRGFDSSTARPLEQFLEHYQKALHPRHWFFMEAKFAIVKMFGNHPNYRYRDLSREQVEKKVSYCRELLELADVIDPGLSLFRGTLLFELQAALVALAKILLSNEIITKEKTQDYMSEAVTLLHEASEILKHEPEMESGGLDAKLKALSDELDL